MTRRNDILGVILDRGPSTTTEVKTCLRESGLPECQSRDLCSLMAKMVQEGKLIRRRSTNHIRAKYVYEVAPGIVPRGPKVMGKKVIWADLPVVMVTADGRFIKSYDTAREAAKDRGIQLDRLIWECNMHNSREYWPARWYSWRFARNMELDFGPVEKTAEDIETAFSFMRKGAVMVNVLDAGRIYTASKGALVESRDGGRSWSVCWDNTFPEEVREGSWLQIGTLKGEGEIDE